MIRLGRKILSIGMMAMPLVGMAEGEKVEADLGTDVVTSYVWRGQKNAGVSIQPYTSLSYKGLSLGAWGSCAIAPKSKYEGSQEELDITLSYEVKGFHVGVTDYYLFENGHPFFKYGGLDDTAHTFEANVGYDFGFLSVNWFTNFAGADGLNGKGKRAYSSYLQLDAPFHLAHLDWNATLGVVPYRTDYYAADQSHGFHVNQVALRAEYPLELKKVKLPVFAQLMANPSSRDLYYLFGFSVKLF